MNASSDTPDEPQRETSDDSAAVAGRLDDETIRRRGSAAMFYVLSWGFANLVITFFGSVVLARLLSPRDFGLIAVGQTVATLASTVAEGGIASGFIRLRICFTC